MSREPGFPEDAAVGGGDEAPAAKSDPNRNKQLATGAAIGIGSAAIVAALLYANRSKKGDKSGS